MRAWAWVQTGRVSLRSCGEQEMQEHEGKRAREREMQRESEPSVRGTKGEGEDKRDIGEKGRV